MGEREAFDAGTGGASTRRDVGINPEHTFSIFGSLY
jgi:hypothetical protein